MEQSNKWIVEQTVIRKMPEMPEPVLDVCGNYQMKLYKKKLSEQPTIQRADNGLWKEGEIKTQGVDFRIEKKGGFVSGNYQNKCVVCMKIFNGADKLWFLCPEHSMQDVAIPITPEKEEKPSVDEEALIAVLGAYNGWNATDASNWGNLLKALEKNFIIQYKPSNNAGTGQ